MDALREAFLNDEKNRLVEKGGKSKAHLRKEFFLRKIKK
jgi:hypothetical protein